MATLSAMDSIVGVPQPDAVLALAFMSCPALSLDALVVPLMPLRLASS